MQVKCFNKGIFDSNCYIVWDDETKDGLIIDAGVDSVHLVDFITLHGINVKYILFTHCHFDHLYFVASLKEKTQTQSVIHKKDSPGFYDPKVNGSYHFGSSMTFGNADILVEQGDTLIVGNMNLEIIHTPGHSQGSICIKIQDNVFTGDTLFKHTIGRVDLPFSSPEDILISIREKLYTLPAHTVVYPGHGPSTTIGFEVLHNRATWSKDDEA